MSTTSSDDYPQKGGGTDLTGLLFPILAVLIIYAVFGVFAAIVLRSIIGRRKWSWIVWVALLVIGGVAAFYFWRHDHLEYLLIAFTREVIVEFSHLKFDYMRVLVVFALPVWVRTLFIAPFVGGAIELFQARPLAQQVLEPSRRRDARRLRSLQSARKRLDRKIPDQVGDMMVLGIAIDDGDD